MDAVKLEQLKREFPKLRELENDWDQDLCGMQYVKVGRIDRIFLRSRALMQYLSVYLHVGDRLSAPVTTGDGVSHAPADVLHASPEEDLQGMRAFVVEETYQGPILHILKPARGFNVAQLVREHG